MGLSVNLRHLETKSLQLSGDIAPADIELQSGDELVKLNHPLQYDLEVQLLDQSLLVRGDLDLPMDCECSRCLKPFLYTLQLADWTCHIPLEGEEKALIINDCVDLTPYLREDIFLAFPQRPLCDANCSGLKTPKKDGDKGDGVGGGQAGETSPWAALNKLKL